MIWILIKREHLYIRCRTISGARNVHLGRHEPESYRAGLITYVLVLRVFQELFDDWLSSADREICFTFSVLVYTTTRI